MRARFAMSHRWHHPSWFAALSRSIRVPIAPWSTGLLLSFAVVSGCSKPTQVVQANPAPSLAPLVPREARVLKLSAVPISDHIVQFNVTTNVPLPIEVMASVDLAGQKDEDIAIGYDERVKITEPTQRFTVDTSRASKPLPSGKYDAEVKFYSRWGAEGNEAAKDTPDLDVLQQIELKGNGETRGAAERRNNLQRWVMETVFMNSPWNERRFVAKLGPFQKTPATLSPLHDAYYFPDADMTLIVNHLLNEVTVWRDGRATQ